MKTKHKAIIGIFISLVFLIAAVMLFFQQSFIGEDFFIDEDFTVLGKALSPGNRDGGTGAGTYEDDRWKIVLPAASPNPNSPGESRFRSQSGNLVLESQGKSATADFKIDLGGRDIKMRITQITSFWGGNRNDLRGNSVSISLGGKNVFSKFTEVTRQDFLI